MSLRSDGYEVLTAENGKSGLELFEKEAPPIVLTDVKMPGIDGIEVLKKIKEISPETEVIVVTGHGDMDVAIQSLQLEASDFITKPIVDEALTVALKRAEERLRLRKKLKEYTDNLEDKVKQATEEIRQRYEFEDNLIQHSIDGIIGTDKHGKIMIFNQGDERIFGYSKDEVIGEIDIGSLYPPETAEEIMQGLHGKERERQDMHVWRETFVVGKDGDKIPIKFSGTVLYKDGEVIGSVGFLHDLREVKQLQQELIRSERLAAIGETVAGLAHGIKNILGGLRGGVYIVDNALKKEDMHRLRTGWDMVQRNIDRIAGLAMDLLNYSKERKPEYERRSPNTIAEEVCKLMDLKAKESGVEIVRDLDPSIGDVSPKGFHRCLLNLVSNAIDAVTFDEDESKEHLVRVTTRSESDGTFILQVSDNGCGMDEAVRKQIFSSLFSTKGSRGTGLGLLVTQKIIHEHGGTIRVNSEPGKGSTFVIRLPSEPHSHEG
ncbi:MAG: histidine kinase [Deltaproteobacteria bacterium]|nr:MAG: histidine kinase [Deltaproteobacteria bacterium]